MAYIPWNPPSQYITLILRDLGFSTVSRNDISSRTQRFH